MKDRENLSIVPDEVREHRPTDVLPMPRRRADRRKSECDVDRTTRLTAEVLGTTVKRAGDLLVAIGGLEALAFASESDLRGASVSPHRARLAHAAFELARQSIGARPQIGKRLSGAWEVWAHMRARLAGLPVEEFWAIAVDVRHRVVLDSMIARGSMTGVEVHPRDVFRTLIKAGAAAVIFCHNHPSGDPEPSRQDIDLTVRLREVGETCGISVLDHVVVGAGGYISLAERGWR
jgi:DNA repair protein RadC